MPLPWPGISTGGGDLDANRQESIRAILDQWADNVEATLKAMGLPQHASPVFRPWNLIVVLDAEKILAAFSPLTGGVASLRWIDQASRTIAAEVLSRQIRDELGQRVATVVALPRTVLDGINVDAVLLAAAARHASDVERENRLGRLGDLTGVAHLEPFLREFLNDHPNPERNVFIMMRFVETEQMRQIHQTIRSTLAERGFDGVRADDRDYTGELWSNIEVYLVGCRLGVAVFEAIEDREFNPNVSLELGYVLGRRSRCLILKEQRLPDLPADVVHRLYKTFDMFNIEATVRSQVLRWTDVDLGVR